MRDDPWFHMRHDPDGAVWERCVCGRRFNAQYRSQCASCTALLRDDLPPPSDSNDTGAKGHE